MGRKTVWSKANVEFAVQSLFDAQIGTPVAFVNIPAAPEPLFSTLERETYERIKYEKLVAVGSTEEDALAHLWKDFRFLWAMTTRQARLYWRYPDRIKIEHKAFCVIARTRIGIPANDMRDIGEKPVDVLKLCACYVPECYGFG